MSHYVSEDLKERVEDTNRVFSEHGPVIHAMIAVHVNDASLADDLYQQLFVSLVKKPLPQNLEAPQRYLWRVVANDVTDAMRKRTNYKNMLQKYLVHLAAGLDNRYRKQALQILADKEKHQKLERIILESDLHPCESKALLEKLNYDSSIQEIAENLGIKERSVSHYLSTGLRKLRLLLASRKDLAEDLL